MLGRDFSPASSATMPALLPPRTLQALGAAISFAVVALATYLALHAPRLDFELVADDGPGLVIRQSADNLPPAGTRLSSLAELALDASLLVEEPDTFTTWADYDRFIARQRELAARLRSGPVSAVSERGEVFELHAEARRLGDLPPLFWWQIAIGVSCFLLSFGVWVFRRGDRAAVHFALSGLGVLLFAPAAAVYSTRGLALSGDLIRVLSSINHAGALLFTAALVMLLWHYPRTLHRRTPALAVYGGAALAGCAFTFGLLPTPSTAYISTLGLFSLSFVFAFVHWRNSRGAPLERAALQWYLISIYLGTGLFAVGVLLPAALHLPPLASQGLMFTVFLFMFVGIALGITRYRLFELDRWWFRAWTWFLGGVAVLLADLALVSLLDFSHDGALALSLALLGWIYFPLRNRLWYALHGTRRSDALERLGRSLERLAAARDEAELARRWREILRSEFDVLEIRARTTGTAPAIEDSGLTLCVTDGADGRLLLRMPERGARLFRRDDVIHAGLLSRMLAHVQGAMAERERVVGEERTRIRRDLHDDLGAKLLSLIYQTHGETQQLARAATQDMRAALAALAAETTPLATALEEWRTEATQRSTAAGCELTWKQEPIGPACSLSPRQYTDLGRILREALTNSLKHARAHRIEVGVAHGAEGLALSVEDFADRPPSTCRPSASIRERTQDLGGEAQWEPTAAGTRVRVRVPLHADAACPAPPIPALLPGR